MTFRDILKMQFGVNLPISGGIGNSIESAVIIENAGPLNDYTEIEYTLLKYIGIGRGIEWKVAKQELIFHEGKKIDKIIIETTQQKGNQLSIALENHYFDITACFGNPVVKELQVKEEDKIEGMKKFLDTLIDDINKEKK